MCLIFEYLSLIYDQIMSQPKPAGRVQPPRVGWLHVAARFHGCGCPREGFVLPSLLRLPRRALLLPPYLKPTSLFNLKVSAFPAASSSFPGWSSLPLSWRPFLRFAYQHCGDCVCVFVRLSSPLRCLASMMPIHSAIASARLTSVPSAESQSWDLIPLGGTIFFPPFTFIFLALPILIYCFVIFIFLAVAPKFNAPGCVNKLYD